ncbi:GM21993 [Drosophila sechellia]|uniref:GM21993 n=1 Tax=Drosophila sechellia TaxID=7238 RepID=B4HPU0_DROSE|nr:GM21993 [Drosophila sechellia]
MALNVTSATANTDNGNKLKTDSDSESESESRIRAQDAAGLEVAIMKPILKSLPFNAI